MKELNQDGFDEALKGKSVIDFWAPWCGPCRMLGPNIEEASQENKGVNFFKVNVDDNSELASKYGVRSIPTVLFMEDGEEKDRFVGVQSKDEINEKVKSVFG